MYFLIKFVFKPDQKKETKSRQKGPLPHIISNLINENIEPLIGHTVTIEVPGILDEDPPERIICIYIGFEVYGNKIQEQIQNVCESKMQLMFPNAEYITYSTNKQ